MSIRVHGPHVHMRDVGEPHGDVAHHRVRGASPFRPRVDRSLFPCVFSSLGAHLQSRHTASTRRV